MRIAQLTPGTGSFHCGSCLRDDALVRGLRALGHEVAQVPLYLPLVLDTREELAAPGLAPLFFGGINVYLQQQSGLFRATPRWLDRLLDGPGLLRWASRRSGMAQAAGVGPLTVSMLRGRAGRQRKELERLAAWLHEQRPDIVSVSNAMLLGLLDAVPKGTPVVCSLQGEDGFLDSLPRRYRAQAWQLIRQRARRVAAFIAPSHHYKRLMQARLEVPEARVHVVANGIPSTDLTPAEVQPASPVLGFLARMCADKGLDRLVDAFIALHSRAPGSGLRLRIAGAQTRDDRAFVEAQLQKLAAAGLEREVDVLPNLTRAQKADFLRTLTVLSVPALYGEAFGLYVLEALACGVPVVQPRHAAFPELLEQLGGGLLYDHTDEDGLVGGLEELLLDPERARRLGATGREAVLARYTPASMAGELVRIMEECLVEGETMDEASQKEPDAPLLVLRGICQRFGEGSAALEVLRGVDLELAAGETLAITGPSGSGKSTLLSIVGLLEEPSAGSLRFAGLDVGSLDDAGRALHRNEQLGFVFQDHHLLPQLSALENVMLPALARHERVPPALETRARELLGRVGLEQRLEHRPATLSGGERQRVAVCRALLLRPALVLADEPTGALDRETAQGLVDLLVELNREEGCALLVVTHAGHLAERMGRRYTLRDGRLAEADA